MTEFTWQIVLMSTYAQIDAQSDVVFQVNWQCQARDENYSAVSVGTVPVTYTAGSPFTPYDQLTQEQVWSWINSSIDRSEIETNLQAMIDTQKTPPVVTSPLPWSNSNV